MFKNDGCYYDLENMVLVVITFSTVTKQDTSRQKPSPSPSALRYFPNISLKYDSKSLLLPLSGFHKSIWRQQSPLNVGYLAITYIQDDAKFRFSSS
jgi:hypothetical protein